MSYVIWDVETTTLAAFKRKASPFVSDNYVVASGWKRQGDKKTSGLYRGKTESLPADWFTRLLKGTKLLVGFNIKFDLLHALRDPHNLEAWMEYVASGGNVWDCQLAEYLLDGMDPTSHMLSLDEVSPRYGGDLKIDEVKALWEAGVDTSDIDRDLLMSYLLGRTEDGEWVEGDIGNTETVFLEQLKRAKKQGQVKSILLNMGALIATTEIERNGMFVNLEKGLEIAEKLRERVAVVGSKLDQGLPDDLPFEFNWNSRHHKSALLFGGDVKYKAKAPILDDEGNLTYYQKDVLAYSFEGEWRTPPENCEFDEEMLEAHADRFVSGKRKGEFKTKKVKVPDLARGPKERYEDMTYRFVGVAEPDPEWKNADGTYSTGADVIEQLEGSGIGFLDLFVEYQNLTKDLGTYYITEDAAGNRKGMLTLVGPDGIIHHKVNQTSTVTGRFSSSDPNLQNVSSGDKSEIKTVFQSRFNGVIIQSDFTSLEVYVQAILSKCRQLIADLKAGLDMHCLRVAGMTGEEYEHILHKVKVEEDPRYKKLRQNAKTFSFQRAYGAGAKKIAKFTGMAEEQVLLLIAAEEERYPELVSLAEEVEEAIRKTRVPTSRFIPHPEIQGLTVQVGRGWYQTPDGKRYSFRESPAPGFLARKGITASFSPTEIKNYPVQGSGGEWMKAALWLAVRMFYREKNFNGKALLINTVHDAAYCDAHESVKDKAAALLHACMLEASTFMEYHFNWPIPVAVPSETVWGDSMAAEGRIDGIEEVSKSARTLIRSLVMQHYSPSFEKE